MLLAMIIRPSPALMGLDCRVYVFPCLLSYNFPLFMCMRLFFPVGYPIIFWDILFVYEAVFLRVL